MMYRDEVRTTIDLSPDVERALEQHRRQTGAGLSQAVNDLLRRAIAMPDAPAGAFRQASAPLGLRIDVSNVQDALDALDDDVSRDTRTS